MLTMKTTKILSAVSAAALLGISSVALAQGTGTSPGSSGAPAGSTMQRQDAPSTGATSPSTQNPSMSGDRMSPSQAQEDQGKKGTKSNQAQGKETQKSNQAQGKEMMGKDAQKSNQAQEGTKDGAKSGSTVGAAPAGAVNLTSEQRATIRQEVLTANAPRANNINFTVNVGTVVPSTVHVVEVPATIIKIHPQWKGYRYFVYNDEIIIVEPRTLKIVAVLNV
jgi:hypothetical protein